MRFPGPSGWKAKLARPEQSGWRGAGGRPRRRRPGEASRTGSGLGTQSHEEPRAHALRDPRWSGHPESAAHGPPHRWEAALTSRGRVPGPDTACPFHGQPRL